MSTSPYQALLVELGRDLEESETEERELRRLERYLLRKLDGQPTSGSAPADRDAVPPDPERRLDLLDAVRRQLVGIERTLDELRILDTRVRRLLGRPSANGRPGTAGPAGDAGARGGAPAAAPRPAAQVAAPRAARPIALEARLPELLARTEGLPATPRGSYGSLADDCQPVECTVFAPAELLGGAGAAVVVACHPAAVGNADGPDERRSGGSLAEACSLSTMLAPGSRLSFELAAHGLNVRPPAREVVWRGAAQAAEFAVGVPEAVRAESVIGKLTVMQDSVPIGRIRFQWRVVHSAAAAAELEPAGHAQRFERAWLCFAPKDRLEVERRARLLGSAGIETVRGNLELDASQRSARGLDRQIDACDLMFVFWSPAAAESAWVQKEWQYGMKRKGGDFLHLVMLGGSPPPQLAFLQSSGGPPILGGGAS